MGDGVNLAVDTPVAEAARYQNAVHALEQCSHIVGCHRFYRAVLTEKGMKLSGLSPDGRIVEMCELPDIIELRKRAGNILRA